MEKWYYYNKNKIKIITIATLIILMLTFIALVIRVNVIYKDIIYKDYGINDVFEYRGTNVKITSCNLYKKSDFLKKYSLNEYELMDSSYMTDNNCMFITIGYEVEKIKEDAKGPDWDSAQIYTLESAMVEEPYLSMLICEERIPIKDMKVGEKQNIEVATSFYNFFVLEETWEDIYNTDFYIYMPDYEGSEYVRRIKIN